jgi:hypothetical protein
MKRCLTSFAMTEMQIKTTIRDHFTLNSFEIIKNKTKTYAKYYLKVI